MKRMRRLTLPGATGSIGLRTPVLAARGRKDTGGLIPRLDGVLFNVPALGCLVVLTGGRA